jgi:hypothetical protein
MYVGGLCCQGALARIPIILAVFDNETNTDIVNGGALVMAVMTPGSTRYSFVSSVCSALRLLSFLFSCFF